MNLSHRIIDAQGLPCPQPVILARKALAEGGFEILEILVDDAASRENLLKFATYAHCAVEEVAAEGPQTRIFLRPQGANGEGPATQTQAAPVATTAAPAQARTVFIPTDGIGQGDADLARLLLRGFLYTLTELDVPPLRIIFMNEGVRLAVQGSDALANLKKLAERGVDILACGTCLEFYKLTAELRVGRITNMYEIAELLLEGPTLTV